MAKKSKKSSGVSVDFTGVDAGGRSLPDGQYASSVEGIPELKTSAESGNQYISWTFKVSEGKYKGRKVWHNTSLQPQALFNLRNLLEAMGIEVDEGEMDLELPDFEGVDVGLIVVNEKYEGKDRPRVTEFIPVEDVDGDGEGGDDDDDDDDEPPAKKSKKEAAAPAKGKKAPPKDEDEDDEADDEDDDEPPAKKGKKPAPAPAKSKKAPAKDEDEDEDEDEDGEDDDEPPAKKPAAKGKAKPKKPSFTVGQKVSFADEDDDELTGKITAIDEDEETATVKVGKDLFEVEFSDLVAA